MAVRENTGLRGKLADLCSEDRSYHRINSPSVQISHLNRRPFRGGINRGTSGPGGVRAVYRVKDREDLAGVVGDPRSRRARSETPPDGLERGILRGQFRGVRLIPLNSLFAVPFGLPDFLLIFISCQLR